MSEHLPNEPLCDIARRIRVKLLAMHFEAKAGLVGSGLSCIDLLAFLYFRWLRPKDRFILSKGHGASALYATLHARGVFGDEELRTFYRDGTKFPAHPAAGAHTMIPAATGSLGHGLPIAGGIAYANQVLRKSDARVACMLSDGDCNEGSTWEAALFAGHHRLDQLWVLVDANGLQGFGKTSEVLELDPLAKKWEAFGFDVVEIDGHDFSQIEAALLSQSKGRPHALICRTVKGKGVSFMEGKMEWHYLPMTAEQYRVARSEILDEE